MNANPLTCWIIPAITIAALRLAPFLSAEIVLDERIHQPAAHSIAVPEPRRTEPGPNPTSSAGSAVLEFLNGDKLHGELECIDSQGGIQWCHPEATSPITFQPRGIKTILWERPTPPPADPRPDALVGLVNGDELPGTIESLTGGMLTLKTWYAGTLSIPGTSIRSVHPLQATGGPIFEGPDSLEGWKQPRSHHGSWSYVNGAFLSHGSGAVIGREFKLPDMVGLDFELTWHGQLQLGIDLCSDRPDATASNAYKLQINNNYVYLQRASRESGSDNIGQAEVPDLFRKSPARVSLRISKPEKTISLVVDGALVKQWIDRGEFAGSGGSIVFCAQGGGTLRLSKIRIAQWDGKFPRVGPDEALEHDVATLGNGDAVSGKVESILNGEVRLVSDYATLAIPVNRVQELRFAAPKAAEETDESLIRGHLAGRGVVTLRLQQWDAKGGIGRSPNFGEAKFAAGAFEQLEFNLGQKTAEAEEMELSEVVEQEE